jgi:hypothetical protein
MNSKRASALWLFTILSLTVLSGFSWIDLTLSPASGGQQIQVTGFLVFPVISALLLLQASALLAAFFTPPLVGRLISAVQVPIVIWHAIVVLTTIQQALQDAVAAEITKATGVVGVSSQAQLVEQALDNNLWYVYLAALSVNILALVSRALVNKPSHNSSTTLVSPEDSDELWENQR